MAIGDVLMKLGLKEFYKLLVRPTVVISTISEQCLKCCALQLQLAFGCKVHTALRLLL